MAPRIIISYDDSDNDRDALALGRLLAFSGAELSLAYVRHFPEPDPQREVEKQLAWAKRNKELATPAKG